MGNNDPTIIVNFDTRADRDLIYGPNQGTFTEGEGSVQLTSLY
jgi:hypothetical protein